VEPATDARGRPGGRRGPARSSVSDRSDASRHPGRCGAGRGCLPWCCHGVC
jgi:hypothetical protein